MSMQPVERLRKLPVISYVVITKNGIHMVQFINASDVPALISDGDTLYTTGMMLAGQPETFR